MTTVWEQPRERMPAGRPPDPVFADLAQNLKAAPGVWALLKVYKSRGSAAGVASHIRRGSYPAFPAGEFEVVARDEKVYVRAKETDG